MPPSTLAVLLKVQQLRFYPSIDVTDAFPQSDYISTTLNLSTVTAVKLSVLFLYRRLFVTRNFRTVTTIVITICIIWWLVVVLLGCFRCLPVDSIWDILVLSRWCLDYGRYFLGALISSVLLDVFILCLPIYMVRRLQLPSKRKVIISGIFLLGAGYVMNCTCRLQLTVRDNRSCVAGILRITLVYSPGNIARYSRTRLEIWSTVETGIGIVCACLPTLSPLIPKNTNWSFNIKVFASSLFTYSLVSKKRSSKQPSGITKNDHGGKSGYYSNLGDNGAEEAHLAHAEGGRNLGEWSIEGSSYPLGSITVKDTVEVV